MRHWSRLCINWRMPLMMMMIMINWFMMDGDGVHSLVVYFVEVLSVSLVVSLFVILVLLVELVLLAVS